VIINQTLRFLNQSNLINQQLEVYRS